MFLHVEKKYKLVTNQFKRKMKSALMAHSSPGWALDENALANMPVTYLSMW